MSGDPGALLKKEGISPYSELDWNDWVTIRDTRIVFLEAVHTSRRGLWDTNETLWGSFLIDSPEGRIYFAGDSAAESYEAPVDDLAVARKAHGIGDDTFVGLTSDSSLSTTLDEPSDPTQEYLEQSVTRRRLIARVLPGDAGLETSGNRNLGTAGSKILAVRGTRFIGPRVVHAAGFAGSCGRRESAEKCGQGM